ncbi:hypothetical protein [Eggerthella lenta]|uniref:hypothetical protein n=1 Tax=Eggerthella lenta TaxID=84112 RepID=UPI002161FE83|nr:hypothetical protein [Eggerthella lenta]
MSPAAFLRDRALSVAVAIVCAIAIGSVVAVLGAGPDASVLAACIVLACAAFALTVDYARRRAFYRDLEQVVGDLDRTYYATALIEPPDFLEGRLAYEALQATGKAAADDVAAHKQQAEAYRDYIELWIHEIKTPIAAAALMASGLHGPQAARIKGELDRIEGYVEQALYYARSTSLSRTMPSARRASPRPCGRRCGSMRASSSSAAWRRRWTWTKTFACSPT